MLKFVTRRLKETVDGTCCIVDTAKAWVCGLTQQQILPADSQNNTTLGEVKFCAKLKAQGLQSNFKDAFGKHIISLPKELKIDEMCQKFSHKGSRRGSSSSNSDQNGKRKFNETEHIRGDLIGALTWSGAIMCGWYATQVLCMQRRKFGWENTSQNRYFKYLQASTRAVHTNVIDSYLVRATPITKADILNETLIQPSAKRTPRERTSSVSSRLTEEESIFENFYLQNLEDVSFGEKVDSETSKVEYTVNSSTSTTINSTESVTTETSGSTSSVAETVSSSSSRQSISEAVDDLVSYIGECENNMALEYINIGDYRKAITHLKLASNHHHPGGIFNLGVCYEKGLGVRKSLKRAMECYQVASGLGHPTAMFNLGVFYAQGLGGLKEDRETAIKCITTAAKLGQPDAISFLDSTTID